jgi:hypothetical protein
MLEVDPAVQRAFGAALYPRARVVIEVSRRNDVPRVLHISWSTSQATLNYVDGDGSHYVKHLASAEDVADAILSTSELERITNEFDESSPSGAEGAPKPDAIVDQATLRGLLLVMGDADAPRESAQALSWLVSQGQLWLLTRRDAGSIAMAPLSVADLRRLLVSLAQQAGEAAAGQATFP